MAKKPEQPIDAAHSFLNMFEWQDNRCEKALRTVWKYDISNRQKLVMVARDLEASETYWRLMAKFTDAFDAAKGRGDEGNVLLALLARVYAAGTMNGYRTIEVDAADE